MRVEQALLAQLHVQGHAVGTVAPAVVAGAVALTQQLAPDRLSSRNQSWRAMSATSSRMAIQRNV